MGRRTIKAKAQKHRRLFAPDNVWPSDGEYMLVDGKMSPMPDVVA